jgi:hypothetical protein
MKPPHPPDICDVRLDPVTTFEVELKEIAFRPAELVAVTIVQKPRDFWQPVEELFCRARAHKTDLQ